MFGRFDGVIFVLLLFITSLLGSIFILGPFIPLAFFSPRIWRYCADRFVGYWLTFPASMLFFLFNVQFRVSGDLIKRDKPAIIIMNHRTRLDWLFFWNALYKMDPWLLTTEKISLKSELKNIPGAGWAMGCGAYIFLNRNYEYDQRVLETMLKYYKDSHGTYQLLLFPEGTDRGERAVRISHSFAERNGLPRYDYVLHPRVTGFNYILNQMRKNDYVEYVYDVTIAYPQTVVDSEFALLKKGTFPEAVHFDVKRYKLEEVIGTQVDANQEVDASKWLTELWKNKEDRLAQYYNTQPASERQLEASGERYVWPVETRGLGYYVAFAFWILISTLWIYLIIQVFWIKIYALVVIAFYIWSQRRRGGVCFVLTEWFYGHRFFFETGR